MKNMLKILKKVTIVLTAVLAGLFLYFLQISFDMNHSLLTPDFHKGLFIKNDIYQQTYNVISTSMTEFIDNLKKSSPDNYTQYSDVFNMLEQSLTPELVSQNMDSVKDGLISYFKGEKRVLPDIYLNPDLSKTLIEAKTAEEQTPTQALASVDRVNLGAILLYIDRNDINDRFNLLKVVYFLFDRLTHISLLFLLLLFICGMLCLSHVKDIFLWLKICLISAGLLWIAAGISSAVYAYFFLPWNIYPISMSLPLPPHIIIAYLRDCVFHLSMFQITSGAAALLLSLFLGKLQALLSQPLRTAYLQASQMREHAPRLTVGLLSFACLLILTLNIQNVYNFQKDFSEKNFPRVIEKTFLASAVTKIIPATEDNIYVLEINVTDKKTLKPISNLAIGITGRSLENDRFISQSGTSDATGKIRFNVDRGNFRLSFFSTDVSSDYLIPSSLFLEVNASGITLLELGLDPVEQEKPKPGFIELEVLDRENKPVTGVEMNILNNVSAPGNPDKIFSGTNTEGIAVFKVNPGNYKINFTGSKFPKKYILPPALEVTLGSENKVRYTLRLSDAKKP